MLDKMLQSIGCVSLADGSKANLPIANNWGKNDDETLVQLLFLLAVWHKESGATGNISGRSLRRDPEGRLLLVFDPTKPSQCEKLKKGADEGRFYLNLGMPPKESDDLVALGVALAELMLAPGNRPPLAANHDKYRGQLAEVLNEKKSRLGHRNSIRLVGKLLQSDDSKKSMGFLEKHAKLVGISQDSKGLPMIKKIGWWGLVRQNIVPAIMALLAMACLIAFSFWSWQNARGELKSVRAKNEELNSAVDSQSSLRAKNQELNSAVDSLRETNASLSKENEELRAKIKNGPDPTISNPFPQHPTYLLFKDSSNVLDREFQKILRKDKISTEELNYGKQLLDNLKKAAKEWWKIVGSATSGIEVKQRIDSTEENVKKILNEWYAETLAKKQYSISVGDSQCPESYEGYSIRLSITGSSNAKKEFRNYTVRDGKLVMDAGQKSHLVTREAGDKLTFQLDYWAPRGYTNWWKIFNDPIKQELPLHAIADQDWNFGDFSIKFKVESLPGPPIESKEDIGGPNFPDPSLLSYSRGFSGCDHEVQPFIKILESAPLINYNTIN